MTPKPSTDDILELLQRNLRDEDEGWITVSELVERLGFAKRANQIRDKLRKLRSLGTVESQIVIRTDELGRNYKAVGWRVKNDGGNQ